MASRRGFTLVEVLIATALLGFSLVVMFGFHVQAVRSNLNARKVTDCTYLAQDQLEELLAIPWTNATGRPSDLSDGDGGSGAWDALYHPNGGAQPTAVNSLGEADGSESSGMPAATYYVTWEVDTMDESDDTWVRLRVRCTWYDGTFDTWHGTTISTYRYRDS